MTALSVASLRHCYQTTSKKYVHGLDLKGVSFVAPPSTVALSHSNAASVETSLKICVVQNGDIRNAFYKKRCKTLTLDITVRISNNYRKFLQIAAQLNSVKFSIFV